MSEITRLILDKIYDLELSHKDPLIMQTSKKVNIEFHDNINLIINLEKVNNFQHVNKFHEKVNRALKKNSIYVSCAENSIQRKKRKRSKSFFFFKNIISLIDFIYKRLIPKLPIFKQIYFALTRGHNRVMTESEIMGRLVSCGFEILKIINYDGLMYIISRKARDPYYDMSPSYGPIFKMKRVGYNGKLIFVYKFRTMSPYSEYIQSKIISENKLDESGKIKDDFRITFYGKFLRKYWIDEFPMFINWLKGELKLVGVRPLSEDYFNRYPNDLKKLRIKTKPGLIPPYYVDLPITFSEICDSERKYLNLYFKKKITTDFNYFIRAFFNIVFKRKRSQ